ncbi:hypothetical protein HFO56_42680 [Rhizobium laguerreae]|uniref:hypothetical protein n=1 Tax=Rhizobium laguerreae TaxID=1076926 RepID=UPI001C90D553|nr:hypothetical protein [Rhizobium laguerreae]MBY3158981.1 hypothetical protein [Rhizobium laguerreae]
MTAESIARRFETRSGYVLIDYAPVALPLYRLTVDAITMIHRDLAPIKEFVMKTIAAGLCDTETIGRFLGLDRAVVDGTLAQLRAEKLVTQSDDTAPQFTLSDRGFEVLDKAKVSTPQDETLVFIYDRLIQKPVRLYTADLLIPNQIDSLSMIEIRAYPAEGPDVKDLSIPEVAQVLERQAGGRVAFGRDLLRLKRILRRVRLYRSGVALVYKKNKSTEILVDFVIDDVRHEDVSHKFAERGGPKKMGFLKSIDEASTATELKRYLGPDVQKLLPGIEELDECKERVMVERIRLQTAEAVAERSYGRPEEANAIEAVSLARESLKMSEDTLSAFPARPIAPYENSEFLELALSKATRSLSIATKVVDRSIVTPLFLKTLENLLKSGCTVSLAVEAGPSEKPTPTEVAVERLNRIYPGLTLEVGKKFAFYHITCDDRFAVVSNRPFLGNMAKVRTFTHVVGFVLQRPDLVQSFETKMRHATPRRISRAKQEAGQ